MASRSTRTACHAWAGTETSRGEVIGTRLRFVEATGFTPCVMQGSDGQPHAQQASEHREAQGDSQPVHQLYAVAAGIGGGHGASSGPWKRPSSTGAAETTSAGSMPITRTM